MIKLGITAFLAFYALPTLAVDQTHSKSKDEALNADSLEDYVLVQCVEVENTSSEFIEIDQPVIEEAQRPAVKGTLRFWPSQLPRPSTAPHFSTFFQIFINPITKKQQDSSEPNSSPQ